jgi:hypothetical protein
LLLEVIHNLRNAGNTMGNFQSYETLIKEDMKIRQPARELDPRSKPMKGLVSS